MIKLIKNTILLLQYFNIITQALLCDPKCIDCDSSNACFQCKSEYLIDQNKICISPCKEGSFYEETSNSCTTGCAVGFEKDNQRGICRSINKCHSINYAGGSDDFTYNTRAQLFENLLIISGKQNLTTTQNYLKVYKVSDDEYGFQTMGTLNGHDTSIITFILNSEEGYDQTLISVSKKMIIAWDMKYGLLKSNITLNDYLYINSDYYFLDQNFLVLNYFDMTQFAIFYYKDWVKSLFSIEKQTSTSRFFKLYEKQHSSPIFGYKIFNSNYLISYDESNYIIKWNSMNSSDFFIYPGLNNSISQVVTFPNDPNGNFFIVIFEDTTDISIINSKKNNEIIHVTTIHTQKIMNIFFDINFQINQYQAANIFHLISFSQIEIIIFSLDLNQQLYSPITILKVVQIFFIKPINELLVIAMQNGLNIIDSSSYNDQQRASLINILPLSISANDFIRDIQTVKIKDITTFVFVGRKLASYQPVIKSDNSIQTTQISQLVQKSVYYERHIGKVNGFVMDTNQKLYISYSQDGSFGVWDTIKSNTLNQRPLRFQLPPWCFTRETCQTGIKNAQVLLSGILLCLYSDNSFITWNFSRFAISLRNSYSLPSKWLPLSNYGFFNKTYFYMSNNKELQIFDFSKNEVELVNRNYKVFIEKVTQIQIGYINSTYYLIETLVNSDNPPISQLRTKFLANFTVNKTVTIDSPCLELEYFQQTQRVIVNYYSKSLSVFYFPFFNSTKLTVDAEIVSYKYSPDQDRFLILTKTTFMYQFTAFSNGPGYGNQNAASISIPVPRKNFGIVTKDQIVTTKSGYTYFQNTGFPLLDNQVISVIFNYLRTCSVYPFKEEISSVSVVNEALIYIGFSNGDVKIAQYTCSGYAYASDYCNTKNTIHNPYLKQSYLFNIGKLIVVDYYTGISKNITYGHSTNDVLVIQDLKNNNMITYSREDSFNLYKYNQKIQIATQFLNGHSTKIEIVFFDADSDILISHSIQPTDLKVIVWSYSYVIQLYVFQDIANFNKITPIGKVVRALIDLKRKQVMILIQQGTLFVFDYINYTVKQTFLVQNGIEFWLDDIYQKFYILYNIYFIQIRNYETLNLENEYQVSATIRSQKITASAKYIHILSAQMITILDRHKQVLISTIYCKVQCLDFLISDKLDQTFTYVRDDSDSVDVYENIQGLYLYSIFGQQDLDIGSIKLIVIDEVNYLLFIGKLSKYITVFFNYLTRQYVGYAFESIFLFWGTTMINQFNSLSVADTSSFYIRSIQEQITSTFKFQDHYKVKSMDSYINTVGDLFYIDGYGIVRRYKLSDNRVKIVNQITMYREIKFYNGFLYILTYNQLQKLSEDCQSLPQYPSINMSGDTIIGAVNNQIFVSTFNYSILQIDYDLFKVVNTIPLISTLTQFYFVEELNELLMITYVGQFIRYNYVTQSTLMNLNQGYYYTYYNLNLNLIFIATSTKQVIEVYPYSRIITDFSNYLLTNIAYSNTKVLNFIFIDEQYSTLYAVQKNDRVIDIYSFVRNSLSPDITITKTNYIPYINSIDSVILEIEGDYIKVQVPWTISYYHRKTFNYYWQVQDPKYIQSIRQYLRHPSYPELVFLSQYNFIVIAFQDLKNQIFNPLIQYNLEYPMISDINIQKNFDLYMIKLLILISGDVVNYEFNIPIIDGIPQSSFFNQCLMQIQNPKSGYQVENQLIQLQNYFKQFNYDSKGIRIEIYGSQFLYFNKVMEQLKANVVYVGNQQKINLSLEENLFTQNENQIVSLSDQDLKLLSKPVRAQFSLHSQFVYLNNLNIMQEELNASTNTTIIFKDMQYIEFKNITIQSINFSGNVSLFDIYNCSNVVIQDLEISQISINDAISIFKFQQVKSLSIKNFKITTLEYRISSSRRLLQEYQFQSSILNFYKISSLILDNITMENIKGYNQQMIFDIKQIENIQFSNNHFLQIYNIQLISYVNFFQDQVSTTIENNDELTISNSSFQDYQHLSHSLISFQGTSLKIINSQFTSIKCIECTGSSLYLFQSDQLLIDTSVFQQNIGFNGGSIAIISCMTAQIKITDTQFTNNQATNSGGAIYLINSYLKLERVVFTKNNALIGGAIRYLNAKPKEFNAIDFKNNGVQFVNNKAEIHSQNWGSYLQFVTIKKISQPNKRLLNEDDNDNDINKTRQLQMQRVNKFEMSGIQSGGFISLEFQIFDEENNLLSYDVKKCQDEQYFSEICEELSQIKLTLQSPDNTLVRVVGSYTAQFTEFQISTKSFSILGIQLIGNPSSSQKIILQVNGIKNFESMENSKNSLVQQTSELVYQDQINLNFRECEVGEVYRLNNDIYQCVECSIGTYSVDKPNQNVQQLCKRCPEETTYCYRSQMQLKVGYWKSGNLTSNIYKCLVEKNCNGDEKTEYCSEGHYGPLCQFCDEKGEIFGDKYQYDNKKGCTNCTRRSISTYIGQTILISILLVGYCIFNILSSLKASEKIIQAYYLRILKLRCISRSCQNNEVNMSVKALTSFLQLFKIISTYTLELPFILNVVPDLFGSPANSAVVTNACELSLLSSNEMPALYWKSLAMITSPILYMLIISIIYFAFIHNKKNTRITKSHAISALVFLFQFVQPNIVQSLIAQMSCKEFDGRQYIAADYTYECYSKQHIRYIMTLIGPGLAFHGIILPVIILSVIYRSRSKLNNAIIRLRYGYVYQDYNRKGFYWEFVKYALKLSIILIQNFYDVAQTKSKYIIIFMIMIMYYMMLTFVRPYQMKKYQNVDEYSTICLLIITVLNYFLNNEISDFQKYFFYFILLLCQYFNQGYLIIQILKAQFEKYIQVILDKLPSHIRHSIYLRYFLQKTDIHSAKIVEKAIKMWMKVYKKSRIYQLQPTSIVKQQDQLGHSESEIPLSQRLNKRNRKSNIGAQVFLKQTEEDGIVKYKNSDSIQLKTEFISLQTQKTNQNEEDPKGQFRREEEIEEKYDEIDIFSSEEIKIPQLKYQSNMKEQYNSEINKN